MSSVVSIVVPVFNGLPHLRDLTDSILGQTYDDLDIVFAEGGSTDGSAAYLATITDPRVRVIAGPVGKGAAANWTAASEAATGEFVKLICQDDLLEPYAVADQAADLQAHPSAVMAIAPRDIVDARGKVLYPSRGCAGLRPGLNPGPSVLRTCYLRGTNVFGEPLAVLFRRAPFRAALPWEDRNPLMLDVMFYDKVASRGDVVVRTSSVGAFRVSTSSWSTRLASVQRAQFEQWQQEYARSLPTPPTTVDRARARIGVRTQTMLRRGAYAWLRLRGSMGTAPTMDG